MSGRELTQRQADILAFIKNHIRDYQRPPTLRSIGERFGFTSTNTAKAHIDALVRKGFLARDDGRSCGIRIIDDDHAAVVGAHPQPTRRGRPPLKIRQDAPSDALQSAAVRLRREIADLESKRLELERVEQAIAVLRGTTLEAAQ